MAGSYSLTLKNDSSTAWIFYLYQLPANPAIGDVRSLVWLASPFRVAPGTQIAFSWSIDFGFFWNALGNVTPGATFSASQNVAADLNESNTIRFSCPDNTPGFDQPSKGGPGGSLVITTDQSVPNQQFSVGISISGAGTFVMPTGPNLSQTFMPPYPATYWIAAGRNVSVGTVLDTATVELRYEAIFPANVHEMTLSLGSDNTWRRV